MVLPALSPEWKEQMKALSYSELKTEIGREETELQELYLTLYDADERLNEIVKEIERESQREETKRFLERQKTIQRLRTRIAERQRRIDALAARALQLERMPPLISVVERYIRLEVAASLWRSVHSLQGWQTRYERSLRSYLGWQTREAPATERIRALLTERDTWKREAERLATQIKIVEAQLTYKKEILPKVALRVSIALYLIIERGSHEYPREEGRYYVYYKPHYRRARHRVNYPKGRFQAILQCIKEGTSVLTPKGIRKIEDLQIGDEVYSIDYKRKLEKDFKGPLGLIIKYKRSRIVIKKITAKNKLFYNGNLINETTFNQVRNNAQL